MRIKQSARAVRIVGVLLATVWLCGGIVGLIAGIVTKQWLLAIAGLLAAWYGVLWAFVARQGRRLTGREALAPWRMPRRPGPGT